MAATHKSEKTIKAELEKLKARAKPDFRGHIPAPAPVKTRESVEAARKARAAMNVATDPFKPGAARSDKRADPVGFVATKLHKKLPATAASDGPTPQHADPTAPPPGKPAPSIRNAYRQVLDAQTQRPEINRILQWEYGAPDPTVRDPDCRPGLRISKRKFETSDDQQGDFFDAHNVRAVRQDLEALTPRHRTALVRQIAMANPKFTADTRLRRREKVWDPMTQLLAHEFMPEGGAASAGRARRGKSCEGKGRPGVRIVAAYRNNRRPTSADGRPRPWH